MNLNNHASYCTPEELASSLKTDLVKGLDWTECESRLAAHGYNEFKVDESFKIVSRYIEQFRNPLIQLLLASVVISLFMGQFDDAISISLAIIIVVTVAFVQEYKSEKSLGELKRLIPPSCKAVRNGNHEEFLAKYLVPGDIVLLATGDRVPADLRLIESYDLSIDESNLTGETDSAPKSSLLSIPSKTDYAASGQNGDINSNFKSSHDTPEKTQESSNSNINLAFMGSLVQSGHGRGIVIGTGDKTQFGSVFRLMQSEEPPKSPLQNNMDELGKQLSLYSLCIIGIIVIIGWLQSRPVLEMFTIGVSLAVAAIPEGLPIVVTVTLALGVMRMARKKAVVKHLPAVETLGCIHVLCTDKTGTLTKNEMTVTQVVTSEFYEADVTGVGYEELGDFILHDLNSDQNHQIVSVKRLIRAGVLCNNATFDSSGRLIGQPTEGAILVASKKLGLHSIRDEYLRDEEISFNSENKFMAVKCRPIISESHADEPANYYVKGAIEIMLPKCVYYSNLGTCIELTESQKYDIRRKSESIESRGLRVLAIATGESLQKLTFLGLIAMMDPPRPDIKECIQTLRMSGIQIKMVTGDSRITATSIARILGIVPGTSIAMSGGDLDDLCREKNLSFVEKAEKLENINVFYRVTPQHKVMIVKMLQSLEYIVSMTGDGVNDVVALKRADIGISMGSGTDVCKEAADVILMDDNLSTIVLALEEGKGIYHNIRNFIKFQLSTSIAALTLIAISTLLHVPNPLNAMQILYINILMDGPPAQSLGLETVDQDVLKQPPRNVKEPVLTRDFITSTLISSFIIVVGTILVFINETKSILEIGFFTNKSFLYAVSGSLVGQLLVIYCPPIQSIFQTEAISLLDLLTLVAISSTVFLVSEIIKICKNRVRRRIIRASYMYLV